MKIINLVTTAVLLQAGLILSGLNGQQAQQQNQEQNLPPLKAQCQTVEENFVKGQNVEFRCVFLFRTNVIINFDDFKKISDKNFDLVGFYTTSPTPVPTQKDYSYSVLTEVLKPNPELKYGKYYLKFSLTYQYPEVSWQDNEDKKTLQTKIVTRILNLSPILFIKVPIFARVDGGEGFQDVVNIGEHLTYALHIFYEKNAVTLLNNQPLIDLDKKYGIRDATQLDNPDLKPFTVINKNDPQKRRLIDRGYHIELIYNYKLALYEVNLNKAFGIPAINVYYASGNMNKAELMTTQIIKIRTNSVLNSGSDFRPLKNILEPNQEKLRKFGFWPIRVAYFFSGLAGLVILAALLKFLTKKIKEVYHKGPLELLAEIKKSYAARINKLKIVTRFRAAKSLAKLRKKPNQENLKKFIKEIRLFMAAIIGLESKLALSHTAQEFSRKINAEALENAEYLLDEKVIFSDDLKIIERKFKELLISNKKF